MRHKSAANRSISLKLLEIAGRQDREEDVELLRDASFALQAGQPTATALTHNQEDWAKFILAKVQAEIDDREDALRENGWKEDDFPNDSKLMDLYDDELFYMRYGEEMIKQRAFIRERYLGGGR